LNDKNNKNPNTYSNLCPYLGLFMLYTHYRLDFIVLFFKEIDFYLSCISKYWFSLITE